MNGHGAFQRVSGCYHGLRDVRITMCAERIVCFLLYRLMLPGVIRVRFEGCKPCDTIDLYAYRELGDP